MIFSKKEHRGKLRCFLRQSAVGCFLGIFPHEKKKDEQNNGNYDEGQDEKRSVFVLFFVR